MSGAAVRLESVVRRFGPVRALDGVTAVVSEGALVALAGANGSGKSTLLRIIAGAIAPDEGSVEVLSARPRTSDARFRSMTGYASQHLALDPEITGRETLELFHALRGLPHRDRARRLDAIVDEFGLASFCERRVGGYSGGQRQRLHLALEMLHDPHLLLLDEPTSSLDPSGREALWRRLSEWRARGRTIIVVTHDLADVETYCDRVIVLERGRIAADGTPAELVAEHGRARTFIELAAPPDDPASFARELEEAIGRGRISIDGATVTIVRGRAPEGPEPALEHLAKRGVVVVRFEQRVADLASMVMSDGGDGGDGSDGGYGSDEGYGGRKGDGGDGRDGGGRGGMRGGGGGGGMGRGRGGGGV